MVAERHGEIGDGVRGFDVDRDVDDTPIRRVDHRAQIEAAARIGAPVIEIHSGAYTDFDSEGDLTARDAELARIVDGVKLGHDLGLEVHVGHGLNYDTVAPIAELPEVREVNIGHFLMGEAMFVGLEAAIAEMRARMDAARG